MKMKKRVSRLLVVVFIFVTLFSNMTFGTAVQAAGSELLVYDGIMNVPGDLHGATGGFGWASAWEAQSANSGMTISASVPLTYPDLSSTAPYLKGGGSWQGVGRGMRVGWDAPANIKAHLNSADLYGKPDDTLWFSMLMRVDKAGGDKRFMLTQNNIAWSDTNYPGNVSAGMFNGNQFWALRVGSNIVNSTKPIVIGTTYFVAVQLVYDSIGAVSASLYVNPTVGETPITADATNNSGTAESSFRALSLVPGSGTNEMSWDEPRLGTDFAAVAPAAATPTPIPTLAPDATPTPIPTPTPTPAPAVNLVSNYTFADGLAGWESEFNIGSLITDGVDDSSAVRIDASTSYRLFRSPITVEPFTDYVMTFYSRGTGNVNVGVDANWSNSKFITPGNTTTWTKNKVFFTTLDYTSTYAAILAQGGSTIDIDRLTIFKASLAAPADFIAPQNLGSNLLPNGDMENNVNGIPAYWGIYDGTGLGINGSIGLKIDAATSYNSQATFNLVSSVGKTMRFQFKAKAKVIDSTNLLTASMACPGTPLLLDGFSQTLNVSSLGLTTTEWVTFSRDVVILPGMDAMTIYVKTDSSLNEIIVDDMTFAEVIDPNATPTPVPTPTPTPVPTPSPTPDLTVYGPELIANGQFTTDLTSWIEFGGASTLSSTDPIDGNYALVTVLGWGEGANQRVFGVEPGNYRISFSYKGNSMVWFGPNDYNTAPSQVDNTYATSTVWTTKVVDFTVTTVASSGYYTLRLIGNGASCAYDNISLRTLTDPNATPTPTPVPTATPTPAGFTVALDCLSAANLLNTGDTVYDAYMNAVGVTNVTIRATYLSSTILGTTTVDPITKTASFASMPNGDYVVSVTRNGYMIRDIAVTVAGGTVSLGDKSMIPGDIFPDEIIDGSDSESMFSAIGYGYGDPSYIVSFDLNLDGILDGTDSELLMANLGLDVDIYGETVNYYV